MMQNVVDLDHQSRKDALTFGGDRRHPYSFLADLNLMRRGMVNFIPILALRFCGSTSISLTFVADGSAQMHPHSFWHS